MVKLAISEKGGSQGKISILGEGAGGRERHEGISHRT